MPDSFVISSTRLLYIPDVGMLMPDSSVTGSTGLIQMPECQ